VLVYKCLHQAAPIYLSELCISVATFAGRSHLRSAVKDSLPLTVRDPSMSLLQFCVRLKKCSVEPTIDHSAYVTV